MMHINFTAFLYIVPAFLLAPFLATVVQKVKALFAGKKGPPLLNNYYALRKLSQKAVVYSTSTTFVFRLGPVVSCSVSAVLLLFFPFAGIKPLFHFQGDAILLFYLLALGRFFTVIAALDTASPFEGMGAAREVYFSFLAEATIFMVFIHFYRITGKLSLSGYFTGPAAINLWGPAGAVLLLIVLALFMVLLTENSRVPVDDPATHLELTMIHEVMILDHSGPDLALIEIGAWCKLLFYSGFIANLLIPSVAQAGQLTALLFIAVVFLIYIAIGVVESITARFKMQMVPKFILTSFGLAFLAAIISMELPK